MWTIKLYVYFFVIGFLLDFTSVPEFLFWQSNGFTVDENRIIGVLIHIPWVVRGLWSCYINKFTCSQINKTMGLITVMNCIVNFASSFTDDFVFILASLVIQEMFVVMLYTCLEYHMVQSEHVVSKSNVSRLFGKAFGQLFGLFQKGVPLNDLFFVSFIIQLAFSICLILVPVDSPSYPVSVGMVAFVAEEEEPKPKNCCQKCCSCYLEDDKPITNMSWFILLVSAIPSYIDILMYELITQKHFEVTWFGRFEFFQGIGAIAAVMYFIHFANTINLKMNKYYVSAYLALKLATNALVVYGIHMIPDNADQLVYLWTTIYMLISFAEEGIYNLFLMDTTKRSDGSVFFLTKCEFNQTLGLILGFGLTTWNLCAFQLDSGNYSAFTGYVNEGSLLYLISFATVYYL